MSHPPPFYPPTEGQRDYRRMPMMPKSAGSSAAPPFSFEQAAQEKVRGASHQSFSPRQTPSQPIRPMPNVVNSAPPTRQSFSPSSSVQSRDSLPQKSSHPVYHRIHPTRENSQSSQPQRPLPTNEQSVPSSAPPHNSTFSFGNIPVNASMPSISSIRPAPFLFRATPQSVMPSQSISSPSHAASPLGSKSSPPTTSKVTSVPPSPALSAATLPSSEKTPGPLLSPSSPSPATPLPLPHGSSQSNQPPAHRTIIIAKSGHQQFANYEVILLIFDTPESIQEFTAKDDPSFTFQVLNPGQLVALCLKRNESIHALHVPIIGVPAIEDISLLNKKQSLVDKLTLRSGTTARRCSVWQTGDYEVYCDESELPGEAGFEQLANEMAEFGDKVIQNHLYNWDKAPHLHASEARRMTFNEQWTYASVFQGQSPPERLEWIRDSQDDALIPCLSIEWAARDVADQGGSFPRVYSNTGYFIEATNRPILIILNRHYPYYRAPGLKFLQLEPPSVDLTRIAVERHQVHGSLDRSTLLLRQLEQYDEHFKEAKQGFHLHPSLAQAALSHLSSFVLELAVSQSGFNNEALQSTITSIANISKDALQSSNVCRYGSAPVIPTSDALSRLLYTSFRCLKETFSLTDQELKPFATAMFSAMSGSAVVSPRVSEEVIECFLITSRHAIDNGALLCGKVVEREVPVEIVPQETAARQMPTQESSLNEEAGDMDLDETADAAANEETTSQLDSDLSDSDEFDFGPPQEAVASDEDEQDLYVDESEETASVMDETPSTSQKRLSEEPLANLKTKQAKTDVARSASVSGLTMRGGTGHEVDGDLFKKLLQRIMARDTDKKQGEHLDGCARLIKTSVQHELIGAKSLPQDPLMKSCKKIVQLQATGSEGRCTLLKLAVEGMCNLAEKHGDSAEWDWIILTLAYQASKLIEELCNKAEKAYRVHFDRKTEEQSPFRHELKKSNSGTNQLSNALINVLDEVRTFLDGALGWKAGPGGYLKEFEMNKKSVAAVYEQVPTTFSYSDGISSSSSTASSESNIESQGKGPIPSVYLTFINMTTQKGRLIDRSTARFKETVFETLFQIYFTPLIRCLNSKTLDGDIDDNEKHKTWVMQRRFLRFRLQLIDKLVGNCNIGTTIFATRACSDLVFAPARYMPLPKEKNGATLYQAVKGYIFPRLMIKQGKYVIEAEATANWQGWEALYSSLRSVKDDILLLAKKKDPHQYVTAPVQDRES